MKLDPDPKQFIKKFNLSSHFVPRSHDEAVGSPRYACDCSGQEAATLPDASPLCYSRWPKAASLTPVSEGGAAAGKPLAQRSDTSPGKS